jgi:hypothetical protein
MSLAFTSRAQKDKKNDATTIPAFGKVDNADLEMKDCDFDSKAEALVLVDNGELVDVDGLELDRRIRIKILSAKGLEWANVHLRYRSEKNSQSINNLEAQTYNIDEKGNIIVTKLDKKSVFDRKINKKYSEKVFTFPGAKVGSVIEYKYSFNNVGLIDWYFQRSIPVKYSRFIIDLSDVFVVNVAPYCTRKFTEKDGTDGVRNMKTYTMINEPGLRDEPFIINEDYYRDRLETAIIAFNIPLRYESRIVDWMSVIKFLMEDDDFGSQLKKNIPHTAELDEKLKSITSAYDKMKAIYTYVQDNMQWNGYTGIWASDGVKSAWKDKKGTVAEINLILVNLLKDAKLTAHPMLVSTHDNGIVNTINSGTYESPGFLQFDKVMALVVIDGKDYVLDASQKETPINLIPFEILLSEGLVIEKLDTYEWGWHSLWNKNLLSENIIYTRGEIDTTGKLTGQSTISSYDYARLDRVATARKGKDKYIERYLSATNRGIEASDVSFDNLTSDSLPLIQNISFTQALSSSGDYIYFSGNILSGFEKNPFVSDNRFSDVFFGVNQSTTLYGNFTLPDGYEFENLPKNEKMIMPDSSITVTRILQVTDNVLMAKIKIEFKKPVYPASQYPEFQEFFKKLLDLLNEQYVIHKKN